MLVDWNARIVIERFAEAAEVLKRLPGPRTPRLSAMPWEDAHQSFEEAVWAEEGRQRLDLAGRPILGKDHLRTPQTYWADSFSKAPPPDGRAIDKAFDTLDWLKFLAGRRDLVDALWFCHGQNLGPTEASRAIAKYRKSRPVSRQTTRIKRDLAVSLIVKALRIRDEHPSRRLGMKLRAGLALHV